MSRCSEGQEPYYKCAQSVLVSRSDTKCQCRHTGRRVPNDDFKLLPQGRSLIIILRRKLSVSTCLNGGKDVNVTAT
jgi:hypothetical protein